MAAFRAGQIRCLTSVGVLGTGFNVPEVELVALLRPTRSTGLYVQQVGRALRCAPGKADALILDYAGLVRMHGPVDAVTVRSATQGLGQLPGGAGASRAKPCPGCGALIALNASTCEACWTEPEADAETDAQAPHEAAADDELAILSARSRQPGSRPGRPCPEAEAGPGGLLRPLLASGHGPEPGSRAGRARPRARLAGRRRGGDVARAPAARAQRLRAGEGGVLVARARRRPGRADGAPRASWSAPRA